MKFQKSLSFSVLVLVCIALTAIFAQAQAAAPRARLTAKYKFKSAPSGANATAAPLASAPAATPGLPLWTFHVQSSRDGNDYSGSDICRSGDHDDGPADEPRGNSHHQDLR